MALLTSPAPDDPDPAGDGRALKPATRDAIQAAFNAWWDRCDEHPGNIAFFYVAGHGLQGIHQIVLASDFGADPHEPWPQAFDVDRTREALRRNHAATQLFFVDACREITTSTVEVPDPPAPPLRSPKLRQKDYCRYDLTIKATSRSRKAYGKPRQVSYFARALVQGLQGAAGMPRHGQWWVSTGKLAERFYTIMRLEGADTEAQRPIPMITEPTLLARLPGPPTARLEFACLPDEATPLADLSWRQGMGEPTRRDQRTANPWTVKVQPGLCYIAARFAGGEYRDAEQEVVVEPPLTPERVMVI